jgi:chromosome segregation ATPase
MHHNYHSRYVAPSPSRSRLDHHSHSVRNYAEPENIIEMERKAFRDEKDRLEDELDKERARRIEMENKIVRLKDELSKKDLHISETEFRFNSICNDNEDFRIENDRLRNELKRYVEIHQARLKDLEALLQDKEEELEATKKDYCEQFEKFRNEGQAYISELTH